MKLDDLRLSVNDLKHGIPRILTADCCQDSAANSSTDKMPEAGMRARKSRWLKGPWIQLADHVVFSGVYQITQQLLGSHCIPMVSND